MLAAWSTAPSEPVFNSPLIRSGPAHHSFHSPMTVTQFNAQRCRYRRLVVQSVLGNMVPHLRSYTARERPKIATDVMRKRLRAFPAAVVDDICGLGADCEECAS